MGNVLLILRGWKKHMIPYHPVYSVQQLLRRKQPIPRDPLQRREFQQHLELVFLHQGRQRKGTYVFRHEETMAITEPTGMENSRKLKATDDWVSGS